jgi:hypothetical protein
MFYEITAIGHDGTKETLDRVLWVEAYDWPHLQKALAGAPYQGVRILPNDTPFLLVDYVLCDAETERSLRAKLKGFANDK